MVFNRAQMQLILLQWTSTDLDSASNHQPQPIIAVAWMSKNYLVKVFSSFMPIEVGIQTVCMYRVGVKGDLFWTQLTKNA